MASSSKCNFDVDDLIAVFGGEIGKDGKKAGIVSLCNVLVVGQSDLVVEEVIKPTYSSQKKTHTVPKRICQKLFLKPDDLTTSMVLIPSLGDLVISHTRDRYKDENDRNITGILYKIDYKLGAPEVATLMSGKEMCEVPFASLIVLQKNTED